MRHNKKRNSGFIYECLVRHISTCLLNNNKKESRKALKIVSDNFCKNSNLLSEMQCMKAIANTTSLKSRSSAKSVLKEVYKNYSKVNFDRLNNEKSKLIKEINHSIGKKLYEYKVPNYKILATTQLLFNNLKKKKNLLESVDKVRYEDVIIEHLMSNAKQQFNPLKLNPKYNDTVYKLVVKKFNEKYNDKLTESQQGLLKDYILYLITEDDNKVKKTVNENVSYVKKSLRNVRDENVVTDADLMKKLNECYKNVVTTDFSRINESNLFNLMQYMKLVEEVAS